MLILPAKMSPKPLNGSDSKPKDFHCGVCNKKGEGRVFKGKKKDGDWGVLPEEWEEVPDKRPNAKSKFVVVCCYDCEKVTQGPPKP